MDVHQHYDLLLRTHRALALRSIIEQVVKPGMRVLDAGCGSGLLSLWAAKAGASEVVGVDLADVSLAKELARENGVSDVVRFIQGDLFDVQLENEPPFDVLLAMVYLNDPRRDEDRPALVHRLKRFLAPTAVMVPDRVRYSAQAFNWPEHRVSDRFGVQQEGVVRLESAFGLKLGRMLDRLAHKPNKSYFPVRRADGSLDMSGAKALSESALFIDQDLRAEPRAFPGTLDLEISNSDELTTIVWDQELLFQDTSIFSNRSIGWVHPSVDVRSGERIALACDGRWRVDNLLARV